MLLALPRTIQIYLQTKRTIYVKQQSDAKEKEILNSNPKIDLVRTMHDAKR